MAAPKKQRKSPYEYFSVSSDIIVLRPKLGIRLSKKPHPKELECLLIERKFPPYANCWALPGGFVDRHENTLEAAIRELREETGLNCQRLIEVGAFSDPNRDPRGRTLTVCYYTLLKNRLKKAMAQDDAKNAKWFSFNRLPKLAFDHHLMVSKARQILKD